MENKLAESKVETLQHIRMVQMYLHRFCKELMDRADGHDQTKLESPEAELFAEVSHKLASLQYGSPEYAAMLKELEPALAHHYARNRHHSEHHLNGISDMTLVDIVEMFCDWKAATLRQNNGNLCKSIEYNADRYGISSQLEKIFQNTVDLME